MRVFVLGLPHTLTTREFCSCAYTMKVWNLCRMMIDRGHEVIHFGNDGSDPVCSEHVTVATHDAWSAVYRHPGTDYFDVAVDTPEKQRFHQDFASTLELEIRRRLHGHYDTIICVPWGGPQRDAVLPFAQRAFIVESGIGYLHSWADFRVFESYAWLHTTLGREGLVQGQKWYWPVIPNAYDVSMFDFRVRKDSYFLYLGRLTRDKGVGLAVDIARRVGRRLILAGQGDPSPYLATHVEYVGPVGIEQRRTLLSGAAALLCPTYYIEPFGGVNVEAQLSGTPVIATDFGAFTETVLHGVTGFRCRTMEQFEFAARHVETIDPHACRAWAMSFSLERVGLMYEEYFRMLFDLAGDGFYAARPSRRDLDWLRRDVKVGT
jgi:glycosyltransferase involved in cell wall biosynthesis